eukprot:TRINITY_DN7324_c0_g1_i9.p1 TRINITY_DN7324_c0_g1~~TRINITY_DN7324_c0_g1_i9.p1  ORF type:complete len:219 (+),score=18.55 TRINITY_DN7324_c0_g1_i9:235-891(+)
MHPNLFLEYFNDVNLFMLGRVLVFDMLCNNCDRIPCGLWNNRGNMGNLMCSEWGPVPIDNQTITLDPRTKNAYNYLLKVKNLFDDLFGVYAADHSRLLSTVCLTGFRTFWGNFSPQDLVLQQATCLLLGMISMLRQASQLTLEDFETIKSGVAASVSFSVKNIWLDMVKLIHTEFVANICKIFASYQSHFDSIIAEHQELFDSLVADAAEQIAQRAQL